MFVRVFCHSEQRERIYNNYMIMSVLIQILSLCSK